MHRVHSQLSLFARGNSRPLQRVSNPVCTDSAESELVYMKTDGISPFLKEAEAEVTKKNPSFFHLTNNDWMSL